MVLETETQRLINISLGKIATYRNQRGNSNLHKNVLVANVLRRVRNTVVDEICTYKVSEDQSINEERVLNGDKDVLLENGNIETRPNDVFGCLATHASDVSESRGQLDDVSDLPVSNCEKKTEHSDFNMDEVKEFDEKCHVRSRCLKRRTSEDDEDDDIVRVKRRRDCYDVSNDLTNWRVKRTNSIDCDSDSDSESYTDTNSDSDSYTYLDSPESSMDVEQICGLVSVFRSSFQGLGFLGNARTEQRKNVKTRPYPTTNNDIRQNCLRRGLSLPDLCAKQAVEGLSSTQSFKMCTPILALTV
ncbi:uncharacterized protein LOC111639292 [Centruroides sculpturatus]|uniref:uncharacterized protein LOC111639292 n=1 Tax=Centruroides sculpturatus TaxID=218467 RepID=UPI000C6F0248|nr:uncharacterized protein LOC111639292 [Centruroides sculpturatus]